jgi:D-methionine transport system ATP-binding protein
MAVLENGEIVEKGSVREVFLSPHSETGKLFMKINAEFQTNQFVEKGAGI